jgi:hypothetical protein
MRRLAFFNYRDCFVLLLVFCAAVVDLKAFCSQSKRFPESGWKYDRRRRQFMQFFTSPPFSPGRLHVVWVDAVVGDATKRRQSETLNAED